MTPADADPPAPLDDETAASLCAGVDPLPLPAARRRALFERCSRRSSACRAATPTVEITTTNEEAGPAGPASPRERRLRA